MHQLPQLIMGARARDTVLILSGHVHDPHLKVLRVMQDFDPEPYEPLVRQIPEH